MSPLSLVFWLSYEEEELQFKKEKQLSQGGKLEQQIHKSHEEDD